jgi:hypothetical protein
MVSESQNISVRETGDNLSRKELEGVMYAESVTAMESKDPDERKAAEDSLRRLNAEAQGRYASNNTGFKQPSSSVSYLSMSSAVAMFSSSSSSLTTPYIGSSSSFFQPRVEASSLANSALLSTKGCVAEVTPRGLLSAQTALTSQAAFTTSVSAMSVTVATVATSTTTSNDQTKSVIISGSRPAT